MSEQQGKHLKSTALSSYLCARLPSSPLPTPSTLKSEALFNLCTLTMSACGTVPTVGPFCLLDFLSLPMSVRHQQQLL